jgi:hypothetical protein
MSVYTIHEQPLSIHDGVADADRHVFVRDGFSWAAFLFTPLWMIWHRLWLVLIGYVVLSVLLDFSLGAVGVPSVLIVLAGVMISLLVGLEAATIRQFMLRRAHWKNVGIVSGLDIEDAERRFFDSWLRRRQTQRTATPSASGPSPQDRPVARPPDANSGDVIGLFPEPGRRP